RSMGDCVRLVREAPVHGEDMWKYLLERSALNGGLGGRTLRHAQGAEVPTWWTSLPVRSPLLTGYVGAVRAEELLAEEPPSRLERTLVALSDILAVPRRELEEQLDASATHDWRADPFARGAYSYIGV